MTAWMYAAWFGVLIVACFVSVAGVAVWAPNGLASNITIFILFGLGCIFLLALIVTIIRAWVTGGMA